MKPTKADKKEVELNLTENAKTQFLFKKGEEAERDRILALIDEEIARCNRYTVFSASEKLLKILTLQDLKQSILLPSNQKNE